MGGLFLNPIIMKTENFKKIKTESNKIFHPKHGWLTMDNVTEEKAKQLWDADFTFIALTKKGAAHYLADKKPAELVVLIETAKSIDDVKAISSLSEDKTVRQAVKNRLNELKS